MVHRKFQALCLKSAVSAFVLAVAVPAFAVTIDYSTTGSFACTPPSATCSAAGDSITYGSGAHTATVMFAGVTGGVILPDPFGDLTSFAEVGTVTTTSNDGGAKTAPSTFSLTITQSSPVAGSGTLTGNVTGNIAPMGSTGMLSFTSTTLNLGGVKYTLEPADYILSPQGAGGSDQIEMVIDASSYAPEPSFFALTGIGFAGLLLLAYRRRQRA